MNPLTFLRRQLRGLMAPPRTGRKTRLATIRRSSKEKPEAAIAGWGARKYDHSRQRQGTRAMLGASATTESVKEFAFW
jgi:hypothetical protein